MADPLNDNELIGSVIDEMKQERTDEDLTRSLLGAVGTNPDQHAEHLKLSKETGLPVDVVERNKDKLLAERAEEDAMTRAALLDDPAAIEWFKNKDNAKLVSDEPGFWPWAKKVYGQLPDAFDKGQTDIALNEMHGKASIGLLTPEEEAQRQALKAHQKSREDYTSGERGVATQAVLGSVQTVPQMWDQTKGRIAGGAAGIAVGGLGGLVVGGPAGAVTGMIGGATVGQMAGGAAKNFQQQQGAIFSDLEDVTNDDGQHLDKNVQLGASVVAALPNAGLDLIPFNKYMKTLPGVGPILEKFGGALTRENIKTAIKNPVIQKAMYNIGKRFATAAAAEGFTEALQQVNQILATEGAKALDDNDFEPISWAEAAGQVIESGKGGVVIGGGMATPGSVASIPGEIKRQRNLAPEQVKAHVEAINKTAPNDKLFQRSPDAFRDLVEKLAPGEKFYIAGEQAVEVITALPEEQRVALFKAVPNLQEQIDGFNEAGGYIEMSKADYATYIAPYPQAQILSDHIKLAVEDESFAEKQEAQEFAKNNPEAAKQLYQGKPGAVPQEIAQTVEKYIRKAMLAAGRSQTEARVNATLLAKIYSRFAAAPLKKLADGSYTGMSATDFLQNYLGFRQVATTGEQITDGSTLGIMLAELKAVQGGKKVPGLDDGARAALKDLGDRLEKAGLDAEQAERLGPLAVWEKLYGPVAPAQDAAATKLEQPVDEAPSPAHGLLDRVKNFVSGLMGEAQNTENEEISENPDAAGASDENGGQSASPETVDVPGAGEDPGPADLSEAAQYIQNRLFQSSDGQQLNELGVPQPIKGAIYSMANFFSQLYRGIDGLKQDRAAPKEWLGMIKNLPGVKQDEIFWTGLDEFLEDAQKVDEHLTEGIEERIAAAKHDVALMEAELKSYEDDKTAYREATGEEPGAGHDGSVKRAQFRLQEARNHLAQQEAELELTKQFKSDFFLQRGLKAQHIIDGLTKINPDTKDMLNRRMAEKRELIRGMKDASASFAPGSEEAVGAEMSIKKDEAELAMFQQQLDELRDGVLGREKLQVAAGGPSDNRIAEWEEKLTKARADLAAAKKGQLTKQDLLDHIKENRIEIKEQVFNSGVRRVRVNHPRERYKILRPKKKKKIKFADEFDESQYPTWEDVEVSRETQRDADSDTINSELESLIEYFKDENDAEQWYREGNEDDLVDVSDLDENDEPTEDATFDWNETKLERRYQDDAERYAQERMGYEFTVSVGDVEYEAYYEPDADYVSVRKNGDYVRNADRVRANQESVLDFIRDQMHENSEVFDEDYVQEMREEWEEEQRQKREDADDGYREAPQGETAEEAEAFKALKEGKRVHVVSNLGAGAVFETPYHAQDMMDYLNQGHLGERKILVDEPSGKPVKLSFEQAEKAVRDGVEVTYRFTKDFEDDRHVVSVNNEAQSRGIAEREDFGQAIITTGADRAQHKFDNLLLAANKAGAVEFFMVPEHTPSLPPGISFDEAHKALAAGHSIAVRPFKEPDDAETVQMHDDGTLEDAIAELERDRKAVEEGRKFLTIETREEGQDKDYHYEERRKGDTRWNDYVVQGGKTGDYTELVVLLPTLRNTGGAHEFGARGNAVDKQTIIMHIRFIERWDVNGKRTLFIEEIQSDWGQAGRDLRRDEVFRLRNREGKTKEEAEAMVPENYGIKTKGDEKAAEQAHAEAIMEKRRMRDRIVAQLSDGIQKAKENGTLDEYLKGETFPDEAAGWHIEYFPAQTKPEGFNRVSWSHDTERGKRVYALRGVPVGGAGRDTFADGLSYDDLVERFGKEKADHVKSTSKSGSWYGDADKDEEIWTIKRFNQERWEFRFADESPFGRNSLSEVVDDLADKVSELAHDEKISKAREAHYAVQKFIPEAPFMDTQKYLELAMRRMTMWAVHNGYEQVAWTPGHVQNKRWSQLNVVADKIHVSTTEDAEKRGAPKQKDIGMWIAPYKGESSIGDVFVEKLGAGDAWTDENDIEYVFMTERQIDQVFQAGYSALLKERATEELPEPLTELPPEWKTVKDDDGDWSVMDQQGNHFRKVHVDYTGYNEYTTEEAAKAAALSFLNKPAYDRTIEGEDMKLSGKGMLEVYDKFTLNTAKKLIEKMDGKLRVTRFDVGNQLKASAGVYGTEAESKFAPINDIDALDKYRSFIEANKKNPDKRKTVRLLKRFVFATDEAMKSNPKLTEQEAMRKVFDEMNNPAILNALGGDNAQTITPYPFDTMVYDVTEKMKKSIADGLPLFQREQGFTQTALPFDTEDFAGRIRNIIVGLTERANMTTMPHEIAHVGVAMHRYFAQLARQAIVDGNDDPEVKRIADDWQKLKEYIGATSDIFTREQEEKVAAAFEDYLMKGEAPSDDLRAIFARFRQWFMNIYQGIRRSGVDVNPKITDVFDRWLASEEQIAKVKESNNGIAAVAAALGLPPDIVDKVSQYVTASVMDAEDKLYKELTAEQKAAESDAYKKEFDALKPEVEEELKTKKEYHTMSYMQEQGLKFLEGPETEGLPADIVTDGDEFVHPDDVAELLGYNTGKDMLRALRNTSPLDKAVAYEVRRRLSEKYPNMAKQGRLRSRAASLVMNDKVVLALDTLIKELGKATGGNTKGMKQFAQQIAQQHLDRIKAEESGYLQRYEVQRDKSIREALKAARAGVPQEALIHLQRAMVNQAIHKGLEEFNETKEKAKELFAKVNRKDKKLAGGIDIDFVGAARWVLAQHGFAVRDDFKMSKFRAELAELDPDAEQYLIGLMMGASAAEDNLKPEDLTIPQFLTLYDGINNIISEGRRQKEFTIGIKRVRAEQAEIELIQQMGEDPDKLPDLPTSTQVTGGNWLRHLSSTAKAQLRRVESWCLAMDGNNENGPFTKYIFKPLKKAEDAYKRDRVKWLGRYASILKKNKSLLKRRDKIPTEMMRRDKNGRESKLTFNDDMELIGFLLHTGNESNLDKLLGGYGIELGEYQAFISRAEQDGTITKEHWDLVQELWDTAEDLKPLMQRAHKQLYGFKVQEIPAKMIDSKYGLYRGGYWPAIVDPDQAEDAKTLEQMLESSKQYMIGTVGKGFTNERKEGYKMPLKTDLRLGSNHLDQVLRFIHLEPAARDMTRIINRRKFRGLLHAKDPDAYTGMLRAFVSRYVTQSMEPAPVAGDKGANMGRQFWNKVRSSATMQLIAYSATVAIQNTANMPVALWLRPASFARGLAMMTASPIGSFKQMIQSSSQMRDRLTTNHTKIAHDIDHIAARRWKTTEVKDFMIRHGYIFMRGVDSYLSGIIWNGAYSEEMEKNGNHEEAVYAADAYVRKVMGSSSSADVSKIEASHPVVKAIMPFYSFFNAQANLLTTEFGDIMRKQGWSGSPKMLLAYLMLVAAPAAIGMVIVDGMRNNLPDDDDDDGILDDWLVYLGMGQLKYVGAGVPFLGQSVNAAIAATNNNPMDDRLSVSPIVSAIDNITATAKRLANGKDEDDAQLIRNVMAALGFMTGVPLGQLGKSVGYAAGVASGEIDADNPLEYAAGLAAGKPKKK